MRTASEVLRSLEQRIDRLERQAGQATSYLGFVKELAKNVGASTKEAEEGLTEWVDNHGYPSFFRGGIKNCTFAFNKFTSNRHSGTMVVVEITNDRGDTRSETIEAFINMSGMVKVSS